MFPCFIYPESVVGVPGVAASVIRVTNNAAARVGMTLWALGLAFAAPLYLPWESVLLLAVPYLGTVSAELLARFLLQLRGITIGWTAGRTGQRWA